jgi:hypothetical protein
MGFQKGHGRVVSKKEALVVLAKLRAGTSSVTVEAQRLGVYHATLRKEIRAAIGAKQYDKLALNRKRKGRPTATTPAASTARRKLYAKKSASRPVPSLAAPSTSRRRSRYHSATVSTFSHVAGDFNCGRCGSDQLKAGTDGNGGGVLWCSCGWTRPIVRVRATTLITEL